MRAANNAARLICLVCMAAVTCLGDYVVQRHVLDREYDFIVVGAGTAGCVVANRLSEVSNWTVLLLEAGGEESIIGQVPALPSLLVGTPQYDWGYLPEADPSFCRGMTAGRCGWTQGKGLGGSSLLNYMQYIRGNRRDYDGWAAVGNVGWSYEDVLQYFRKSEDNRDKRYAQDRRHHGTGGYLPVQQNKWETPLSRLFLDAGIELGYPEVDVNGERQTGVMKPQLTVRNGERCSHNRAFLQPVRHRRNLHVALKAMVHRIVFDRRGRAVGVRFRRGLAMSEARARREVILSAGALASPKLLMLSGIGPAQALNELEIPVLASLQGVGRNLQDHISVGGITFAISSPVSWNVNKYNAGDLLLWGMTREGPFTIPGGVEGQAFVRTKYADQEDSPDVQLTFAAGSVAADYGGLRRAHRISNELWKSVYAPLVNRDAWMVLATIMRPKSSGYMTLKDRNPESHPVFHANYLSEPDDIKVLIEAAKTALKFGQSDSFKIVNSTLWPIPFPACRQFDMTTDEYWECHLREYTLTEFHFCGTAKMGNDSDAMAVLDPRLRVRGVNGLRVIDASVIPSIPSANIMAAVTMIAEKGADMIKQDWL